jgi:hypothetical protein
MFLRSPVSFGSASNKQLWEIVIRDRATLGALVGVEGYAGHLAGAALGIVPVMAGEREEQEAYEEGTCARGSCSPPGRAASAPPSGGSLGASPRRNTFSAPRRGGGQDTIFRGYPKEDVRRGQGSTRKPLSEILYEERYGA